MERGIVIAIDGPAGAGKSTLARGLARALGVAYVNTGLMYRALAARALAARVSAGDDAGLERLARELRFGLDVRKAPPELTVDGRRPPAELHSMAVEEVVSQVSAHPRVRAVLRETQRAIGAPGAVVEGRDIASVVFPDADVKLFVTADARVRAARRRAERPADPDVLRAVERRDRLDARTVPLHPAPGARVLDTTTLAADEALAAALRIVRSVAGHGPAPEAPR